MRIFILLPVVLFCCAPAFAQTCTDLQFHSQADIDSFAYRYPGCTKIGGYVTISGTDITNLHGLAGVSYIGDELDITGNPILRSLRGLENIGSIGFSLHIQNNPRLLTLDGLQNLVDVDLIIIDKNLLLQQIPLNSLVRTALQFYITNNKSLKSLRGLKSYKGGNQPVLQISNNDALVDLKGLEGLEKAGSFNIDDNKNLRRLEGLNNLVSTSNTLSITGNPRLKTLHGLESLRTTGYLIISNNDSLMTFDGLNALWNINGSLVVSGNPQITSFHGLAHVMNINNIAVIKDNNGLTNLDGFNSLRSVGGIHINGNPVLQNLAEFKNITKFGAMCVIEHNPGLRSLHGLENLQYGGTSIEIIDNDLLENLSGLNNLESIELAVDGLFLVRDNQRLKNLSGIDKLASVGKIRIEANDSLQTLSGFEAIRSSTHLFIRNNPLLQSLNGLNDSLTIKKKLEITDNPKLAICSATPVCIYLSKPGEQSDISGNAEGCNSYIQVQQSCGSMAVKFPLIRLAPNPVKDVLFLRGLDRNTIYHCTILNEYGNPVQQINITNSPVATIPMSSFKSGIYYLKVLAGGGVHTYMFVKE